MNTRTENVDLEPRAFLSEMALSRRHLMQSAAALSLLYLVQSRHGQTAAQAPLQLALIDWLEQYHPVIRDINADFGETFEIKRRIATAVDPAILTSMPTDLFIGMTPFLEMDALMAAGTIEPWNPYLSEGMVDGIPDPIRAECSVDGNLMAFPVLYDIVSLGGNADILSAAGLDPDVRPSTWDELLDVAARIQADGLADFGCIFDGTLWQSLIPVALTISPDVWREDGTFAWASDPAVAALEILGQMTEVGQGNPSNTAAYFVAMHNFHVWYSNGWDNPSALRQYPLPSPEGEPGRTVFWDTTAVLITEGGNKSEAANYVEGLVTDPRLWAENFGEVGAGIMSSSIAQLPPLESVWEQMISEQPEYLSLVPWAEDLWTYGLEYGQAIPPTPLGLNQFMVAQRHVNAYLNGTEADPSVALQKAQDAVDEALEKM